MKKSTQKPIAAVNHTRSRYSETSDPETRARKQPNEVARTERDYKPDQQNDQLNTTGVRNESGVAARAFLVVMLSLTLVGVLRWALNVTNANARQISSNLTRLQGHYADQDAHYEAHGPRAASIHPTRDPIIEPDTH